MARSPPPIIVLREATVGPVSGTRDVSGRTTSTASGSTPSASATTWARTVRAPWPISVVAASARMAPSAVSSTVATLARCASPDPVNPAPCQPSAIPMPEAERSSGPAAPRAMTRPHALEARRLGRGLEHVQRRDALAQDLSGRRGIALAVGVAAPDLERGHAEGLGDAVEVQLGGELRTAGAPKPRNAPLGGVLVMAARARTRTLGQRYGPVAWIPPRDTTTGDTVVYAPASSTNSMSCATSRPSRVTPVRCRVTDGWRFVVAARSSCRSYAIRTGRPALRASSATWIARSDG